MTDLTSTVLIPGTYRLDPARTTIELRARHVFGLGSVTAHLALRHGELVVAEPATASTARVTVDAASFSSGDATRDEHVRAPKFLDTARFPDIVVALSSAAQEDGGWSATGTLTAHGVTRPLRITAEQVTADGPDLVIRATARVDRHAHGVTAARGLAGRWMTLAITARATPVGPSPR